MGINHTGTKIYVDGDLKHANTTFVSNTYVAGKALGIGVITNTGGGTPYSDGNIRYFNGILDDIRIYNRSLSISEIQALYNEGNEINGTWVCPIFYTTNYDSNSGLKKSVISLDKYFIL